MQSLDTDSPAIHDDDNKTVIDVDHVSMEFNIANQQFNSLKEYFLAMMRRELIFKKFRALNDITFEVKKGDIFGILGVNGSGKSTLLKIISGILNPTSGHVTVEGKVAPLIELGAGFDHELTARENIFLNGALLGYSKSYIEEKFDEIVDFAEVRDFLDMPLKNFSSGMISRVAFAIATVVVPDILIVDEVLSVGDFMFKKKCEDRINELIEEYGTTILLVSHSDSQIQRMCNKALWIDKGNMRMIGPAVDVANMYGITAGRTGSEKSKELILQTIQGAGSPPTERVSEHTGTDVHTINRSLVSTQKASIENHAVIIVPTGQTKTHLLALSLGKHIDAPVMLVSKKDPVPANSSFLQELDLERVVIIDHSGSESEMATVKAALKALTGITPKVLSNDNIFDLSLSVLKYGEETRSWEEPIIVEADDVLTVAPICPLLFSQDTPLLFLPPDFLLADALCRLNEEHPAMSPRPLDYTKPNSAQEADNVASLYGDLQPLDSGIISHHRKNSSDSPCNIVVTPPQVDSVFVALQLATIQKAYLVIYDNKDLDEIAQVLMLVDSLRPIDRISFVNHSDRKLVYSESDKRMITSAAYGGLALE